MKISGLEIKIFFIIFNEKFEEVKLKQQTKNKFVAENLIIIETLITIFLCVKSEWNLQDLATNFFKMIFFT